MARQTEQITGFAPTILRSSPKQHKTENIGVRWNLKT
jgi:hypothetical protein